MNSDTPREPAAITLDHASTLLRLGLTGPRRPVDDLIDRLCCTDGPRWFEGALNRVLGPTALTSMDLAAPGISVEALTATKERCKLLLRDSGDAELSLAAIAGYFLSIAAGLRYHHVRIGGQGRAELSEILLDLAAVAPSPWRDMLGEAALIEA